MTARETLTDFIRKDAGRLGFSAVGIAPGTGDVAAGPRLDEFIAKGRYGTMGWMPETAERRRSAVRATVFRQGSRQRKFRGRHCVGRVPGCPWLSTGGSSSRY